MWSRRPRSRIRRIGLHVVNLDEIEAGLKARLEALPPAARAELLHVLMTSLSKLVQFLPQPLVLYLQPQNVGE
jgi:hypothetical protein